MSGVLLTHSQVIVKRDRVRIAISLAFEVTTFMGHYMTQLSCFCSLLFLSMLPIADRADLIMCFVVFQTLFF